MDDCIVISELELSCHIGITAKERANPQRLTASLRLYPKAPLSGLNDNLSKTIDYAAVSVSIQDLAAEGERNLLETLAEEIAATLLAAFPLKSIELDLRKYILPNAVYTAVQIQRP